ncbi:retrovirus-related Pol polyprotein from transposon TNT 1-94 [Trichonephila inaurata madagascariensis]|uniref:Retrovirus-related Pol polyprotein from transposon TNT 1-94 n=1 Tax=Trichonephila inaurata madagascariensis TaxID=2747483 RepID=A0A8X6YII4_9ARAC|nr:retrovirus-related Pol polyprotein from transposon TNT 1-94 [Trichonephila inaurata madagascariensis]
MTEEKLLDHIITCLDPHVIHYVEMRNSTTKAQLLQLVAKYEERHASRGTQDPINNVKGQDWDSRRREPERYRDGTGGMQTYARVQTEMEFKVHIEKLVGAANWSKWKRQIELLLRHHDIHDIVSGNRKCPSLPAEASGEAIAAHEKVQKAFIKDDSLAQLILEGNMDDSNPELTAI